MEVTLTDPTLPQEHIEDLVFKLALDNPLLFRAFQARWDGEVEKDKFYPWIALMLAKQNKRLMDELIQTKLESTVPLKIKMEK